MKVFKRAKMQCGSYRLFATLGLELVAPRLRVVGVLLLVVSREEAILEVEARVAEEQGVRMGHDEVLVVQLVGEDVVDDRVLERGVGARPDARVDVRRRRGP